MHKKGGKGQYVSFKLQFQKVLLNGVLFSSQSFSPLTLYFPSLSSEDSTKGVDLCLALEKSDS
jgi:hypothetical protein